MSVIDDFRNAGASLRITEEVLYAEALREVEAGVRRDGLWAKALADSGMRVDEAQALYLKLRVQSLRDEIALLSREQSRTTEAQEQGSIEAASSLHQPQRRPPSILRGVMRGCVAGTISYGVFAVALDGRTSQFPPSATTFLFFAVVGALVGLWLLRE